MNSKKQGLILDYLISSPDIFAICSSIIKPGYFDPELRSTVKFMLAYYDEYHNIPTVDQVYAETDIELAEREITTDKFKYCCNEVEVFCRRSALRDAVLAAPKQIEEDDYGTLETAIKNAITISLNKNLGLNFFRDVEQSLTRLTTDQIMISTGWTDVDKLLNGGIQRGTLNLFSAGSGGGKSITMLNLGLNLVEQNYDVLYLSLEMSEDSVSERTNQAITGISREELKERLRDAIDGVNSYHAKKGTGNLTIRQLPAGINCNDVRSYLKEYELEFGKLPDAIVLDYLDLMSSTEKISSENVFAKDKSVSEGLRNIAVEYKLIMISASQLNRSAVGAEVLDHSHIAGGMSKINTTDVYIAIILSDTLKAAGQIAFNFQKTRSSDGVGKTTYLAWDRKRLRITNPDPHMSPIIKPTIPGSQMEKRKQRSRIADIMGEAE